MHSINGSSLKVVRLPLSTATLTVPAIIVRPHPLLSGHVCVVDVHGTYRILRLTDGGPPATVTAVFELQLSTTGGSANPVRKEWCAFEHLPDDGLLLCQRGSGRILFAQLPLSDGDQGAVFLFGAHDAPVLCLASNRDLLVSGGADGCVRLWSLDSGGLLDCKRHPGTAAQVTAVTFIGPLMVAAGADHGEVCVYDLSSGRMEAVQRFRAGDGPVTALAGRVRPQQAHDAATAAAPRGLDGGGLVPGPVGLPWRSAQGGQASDGTDTLLAAGSTAGWLRVFSAARSGELAWQPIHYRALGSAPLLSYSPDGGYLAVGADSSVLVLDAETMQVIKEQHFPGGGLLAGAGFMPAATGGSALVAVPRGGTLAGGMRLRVYGAPALGPPALLEFTVPLHDEVGGIDARRDPEAAGDEDYLSWLQRTATSPAATAAVRPGAPSISPAAAPAHPLRSSAAMSPPGGITWGWEAFAPPSASTSVSASITRGLPGGSPHASSLLADSRAADRSPSWEPWASPRQSAEARAGSFQAASRVSASASAAAVMSGHTTAARGRGLAAGPEVGDVLGALGGGGDAGAGPGSGPSWQAYRPSTQPAPRSWITGRPPRAEYLPQAPPPAVAAAAPRVSPARGPAEPGCQAPVATAAAEAGRGHWARGSRVATRSDQADWGGAEEGPQEQAQGLMSEPELPHSGALLPTSGVSLGGAAQARRDRPEVANDGEGDDGAAPVGGSTVVAAASEPAPTTSTAPSRLGPVGSRERVSEWERDTADSREYSFARRPGDGPWGPGNLTASGPDVPHEDGMRSSLRPAAIDNETLCQDTHVHPSGDSFRFPAPAARPPQQHSQGGQGPPPPTAHPPSLPQQPAHGGSSPNPQSPPSLRSPCPGPDADLGAWGQAGPGGQWRGPGAGDEDNADVGGRDEGDEGDALLLGGTAFFIGDQLAVLDRDRDLGGREDAAAAFQGLMGVEGGVDEDEDLVPRGAAGLPMPEPERSLSGQSQSQPHQRDHQHLGASQEQQRSRGGALGEGEGSSGGGAQPSRPEVRRSISCSPQEPVASAEEAGNSGWGAWANEDVFAGQGGGEGGAESSTGVAASSRRQAPQFQAPPAHPRGPKLRQPPGYTHHRMQLSLGPPSRGPHEAASGTAKQRDPAGLAPSDDDGPGADGAASRSTSPGARPPPVSQQQPAAAGPVLRYTGFKPHPAKVLQQLRQGQRQSQQPTRLGAAARQLGSLEVQLRVEVGLDGNAMTPAGSMAMSGAESAAPSLLQSPAVLLGSPNASSVANTTTTTTASVTYAASRARRIDQQQGPGRAAAFGGGPAALHSSGPQAAGRRQLQHLRQLRQQQHQMRHHERPTAAQQAAAATAAAATSIVSPQPPAGIRSGIPRYGLLSSEAGENRAGDTEPASEDMAGEAGPAGPGAAPYVPQLGSTAMLLRKMQALERVLTSPPAAAAASRQGGGGGGGDRSPTAVDQLLLMGDARREEAARRAATLAANVPPEAQLYHDLPALDHQPQQPARVAKQLHPGWVASRQLRPELGALWSPAEYATEVCNTRGVALYVAPSTASVAASLLQHGWL